DGTTDGTTHELRVLLEGRAQVELPAEVAWVVANTGAAGFYRCEPSAGLRRALAGADGPRPERPAIERFALVDDAWASLLAGTLAAPDMRDLFELVAPDESDPAVWRRLARAARDLHALAGPEHAPTVEVMVRDTGRPALERAAAAVAADPADAAAKECREVLLTLLGTVGADPEVREQARALWDDPSDAALQAAALHVVASTASVEEHAEIERRWRSAPTPQDEQRYLHALAETDHEALFVRTVGLARTDVRSQDAPYLLRQLLGHPLLGGRAWDAVESDWSALLDQLAPVSVPRMLEGVRHTTDPALAARIATFLTTHPVPVAGRQVEQHLERMQVNVATATAVRTQLG
ncbi:MAG: ERAP1-like C-terminal domain-containing protein, partial [Actinomycetes bacterium]